MTWAMRSFAPTLTFRALDLPLSRVSFSLLLICLPSSGWTSSRHSPMSPADLRDSFPCNLGDSFDPGDPEGDQDDSGGGPSDPGDEPEDGSNVAQVTRLPLRCLTPQTHQLPTSILLPYSEIS